MIDQATAQNYTLGRELCFTVATVIAAEGKRKYNIQTVSFRQRGGGLNIQIRHEKNFTLAYHRS